MWVIRKSSLCPQGQIFTCFCLTYSSHFPSSKMGRGRECLSLSSGALPFICASGNRSHCFPPLLPLWLLCEFGFLFLKWCLSLNSGKTWKEKKKKNRGNKIRSDGGRCSKDKWQKWSVIIVARWQLDHLRQGFTSLHSWAPCSAEENPNPSSLYQLPPVISHGLWVLRLALSLQGPWR